MSLKKSLVMETIMATEAVDTDGERLSIAGADITPLVKDKSGYVNSDHLKGFSNLVGRIISANKVMKAEDAQTDYQRRQWNKLQRPFLAGSIELYDGCGHKEADAIASIARFYIEKGEDPPIKTSVEGKKIETGSDGHLKKTLIRGLALTITPANKETHSQVVGILKSEGVELPGSALSKTEAPAFIEVDVVDQVTAVLDSVVRVLKRKS